ncbi:MULTISPECIES: TetR/AcrR family transcriptional regulator [unclassified Pseudoclavibacter]|uniref:TetR/AcrR family transcriptional regulator n=1 Tax=unclassified Pseudoclavibacter TaxID=2615177 RepID=UPI001BA8026A|nr:TetR/AcrR family transcriptional regulator C-terminal domain-containing protein [Pseudoclavibacter sp. Marseille-Q4354]MBS3178615.1 TetR/AcrR family transcriptional regulator C-terminal domain-containing protein [Pseudoclavibacter sp. Marseille-Q4354]
MDGRRIVGLTPTLIADAGLELVEGGEPFGVNAIARNLGVRPSSLYKHVSGLDDIVELMRGRLVERYRTLPADQPWDAFVEDVVRRQRRMYADHPALLPFLIGKTITSPTVIDAYDDLAVALQSGGFPDDEILTLVGMIDAFALGFGLELASPEQVWQPEAPTQLFGKLLAGSRSGPERVERSFELALGVLLAALRDRLPAGDQE